MNSILRKLGKTYLESIKKRSLIFNKNWRHLFLLGLIFIKIHAHASSPNWAKLCSLEFQIKTTDSLLYENVFHAQSFEKKLKVYPIIAKADLYVSDVDILISQVFKLYNKTARQDPQLIESSVRQFLNNKILQSYQRITSDLSSSEIAPDVSIVILARLLQIKAKLSLSISSQIVNYKLQKKEIQKIDSSIQSILSNLEYILGSRDEIRNFMNSYLAFQYNSLEGPYQIRDKLRRHYILGLLERHWYDKESD